MKIIIHYKISFREGEIFITRYCYSRGRLQLASELELSWQPKVCKEGLLFFIKKNVFKFPISFKIQVKIFFASENQWISVL